MALLLAWLAGCGGGSSTVPADGTTISPASRLAAQCASPRTGIDVVTGQPYPDVAGSVDSEKAWVRAWIDDTYLWYGEVPDLPAASYASAVDYFAVLKSGATTPSGRARDRFHFTYATADWLALSRSGAQWGYGIDWTLLASSPPREVVISQVLPGSVADQAGLQRGASVLMIDGVDVVNGTDVTTLNNGLYPRQGGQIHRFVVRDLGAAVTRDVALLAGSFVSVPVQGVKILPTASGPVGYLLFNDHIATAESLLIDAMQQLQVAHVVDLVLDMRYNGGGYLDIAAELAYMVAGPEATAGKVFEREVFNDKNPFGLSLAGSVTPFHAVAQGFSVRTGVPLPSLGLKRVFVLTSGRTCSASEAVINGLRGAGITVELLGATTCGKPYGFYPQDNCGTTYFAVQFKGVNQVGFGDYADGLAPTCAVADDFAHPLGDLQERQLAAALSYRSTGVCSVALSAGAAGAVPRRASDAAGLALQAETHPARSNRIRR